MFLAVNPHDESSFPARCLRRLPGSGSSHPHAFADFWSIFFLPPWTLLLPLVLLHIWFLFIHFVHRRTWWSFPKPCYCLKRNRGCSTSLWGDSGGKQIKMFNYLHWKFDICDKINEWDCHEDGAIIFHLTSTD